MKVKLAAAAAAMVLVSGGALAQNVGKPALLDNVVKCRNFVDDKARLACFDAATSALATATNSGSLMVVDKEEVKQARRGLFGFNLPKLPFLSDDEEKESEKIKELATTLKSVKPFGYEMWQFELASGGTWETVESQDDNPLPKVGAPVVVKKGPLGNYMAKIGSRGGIRVRRIK
ncbi:MAG TPA: hypothetical protein VNT25_04695 [Allosphingosinicella sp.]|nr:hypothetical protein [Allosphingosinicella sp.]